MKKNVLLIPFVAVLTLLVVSMASAMTDADNIVAGDLITKFNGVTLGSNIMNGDIGDTVPVRVTFVANATTDVTVLVSMDGFRDDVEAETSRFSIVAGKTYTKLLSLRLPSSSDDQNKEYTLKVSLTHSGSNAFEEYTVSMQRTDDTFEVLSVDYNSRVEAGAVLPVSVVVKNTGYNRMDDTFVIVSIPALDISVRAYVGDLVVTSEDKDDDEEDSMNVIVNLMIPADVVSGVYEMEVIVYNNDGKTVTGNLIAIDGVESDDTVAVLDAEDNSSVSTSVVALTVILVIVFVVLLAVLVILLTKKGKSIDEVETSYY